MRAPVRCPSPNHDARPAGAPVDILLLHYTGMPSGADALARLCDRAAKVSAHYVVEEDGTVYALVPEARRAWHAGHACWAGERDVNGRSIGVELVNPGHEFGYRPFAAAQMDALVDLARDVLVRHPIPPGRVLAHSDVAPERKRDPGELFDWPRLAAAGVGLWPADPLPEPLPRPGELQGMLARVGYCVPESGRLDDATRAVVAAFQRRFRPAAVTGQPDGETAARLRALLAQLDASAADA